LRHEDVVILVMAPGSNDADMDRHVYWQHFLYWSISISFTHCWWSL